ncbi:hypothetical protein JVU11DRAFT_11621 [Chiua virens]|nr:hypothetical protein JVU11DRAFT_11621 [Chiua virens]
MNFTTKSNFFGKGSVVVPSDGEGAVRRLAIASEKLVTRPFEGIDVIPDVIAYAARVHGNRNAVGWRTTVRIHEEEKEVKKMVAGKEVTETKKWKYFELSEYQYLSFTDVQTQVSELARGLLHHNIGKEDVFNIYAQTSVNWQLMSHACMAISTIVATAYDTLGEAGLTHSLNEPNCVGIFTNAELLPTLARVIKDTPSIRLVVYDGDAKSTSLNQIRDTRNDIVVTSIEQLRTLGKDQPIEILEPRKPTPDDVAMIMYTSGSTGAPKGVVLTHGNVVASIGGVYHLLGHHLRHDDTFLAYLPLAHILEYVVEITLYACGMKTGYGRVKTLTDASVRNSKGDIAEFRPTILVGVPQVWEMIRKGILAKVNASGWKKYVFYAAIAVKKAQIPVLSDIVDASVLRAVKAATGGRLRLAMSGGAALSSETQEFLSLALVTVLQGYGMTESCAMCAVLPPELMQYGAVGLPSPCIEIKLIDVPDAGYQATGNPPRGEGYYKRPDLNEDKTIFTEDGWLRTGDVGQWNPDGTLSVIDRIKNLVKLQGGEYIALERLEATQPIGIIIPHEVNLRHAVQQKPLPGGARLGVEGMQLVGKNNDFKSMEMLEAVILSAEEWTPENGLVTAAQKVQRSKVAKHFEQEIKTVYKNQ